MKNKDRISEILSDNNGLEPETLEKISKSCSVLSDKQKNRIFDIIQAKENETETADTENNETENTVRVIEYRKKDNIMKIIAAAAACICLVTGINILGNRNENINTGNDNVKTTTVYETEAVTVTEVSETKDSAVTSEPEYVVTVTEMVISEEKTTENAEPSVTAPSSEEKAPEVSENTAVTEAPAENTATQETESANELKNIKDDMLKEDWSYNEPVQDALRNAGFNEEQMEKMKKIGVFTKFADNIESIVSVLNIDKDSKLLTGYSYESFTELTDYFFTDNAELISEYDKSLFYRKPSDIYEAENINGELRIIAATPVCHYPVFCEVTVTESTESSVKFTLHCGIENEWYFNEYMEKYDDPSDVVAAFNASEIKSAYGPHFTGAEYSESKGYLLMYDYQEEMVKTADGWKFSVYDDFRR